MDVEEGGALEAARAPLVQDPQSPGSPFSRLLSTTSRAEDELFRTARTPVVLRDFGGVFKDQYEFLRSGDAEAEAAANSFYGRSAVHAEGDAAALLSHSWGDGALLKYLALCYRSNLAAAVVASTVALVTIVVALLAVARGDPTAYGGEWWLTPVFAGGPGIVFVVAFLYSHRLPGGRRRERLWLDKICIHQRRAELRSAGLAGIPTFIEKCDRLVVLQGESYFERLWWCVYEVAVFLASHDADAVDIVPLWLAPWLLVTMAASLAGCVLALTIYQWLWAGAPELMDGLMTLICTLGFVIVAPGAVAAAHARERVRTRALRDLQEFTLARCKCAHDADRARIGRHIDRAFGGHEAFESLVRSDMRRALGGGGGTLAGIPFAHAALPFLPLLWVGAANVFSCNGGSCAAMARQYTGDDGRRAQLLVVISNALYWMQSILIRLPTYPLLFRVLATTSSSCARFVGDCVLVWAAYAVPCVLAEYPGSWFCYRSLMRGDVWAAGCVAWFYLLIAGNVKLFSARPRTRLGPRPPTRPATRPVSSIRSPRGDDIGPQLTFFPAMPTAAPLPPAAVIARRRARHPCSRCVDGVIAAVWQGCREDPQHAIAAKTQET